MQNINIYTCTCRQIRNIIGNRFDYILLESVPNFGYIIILAGTAVPSTTTVTIPTDVTGETRMFI